VYVGGSYDEGTGVASGGTAGAAGLSIAVGEIDPDNAVADYTRLILIITPDGVSLRGAEAGDFDVINFSGKASSGDELATAGGADFGDGVAQVSVGSNTRTVVNTLLLFAAAGTGPFTRSDCNGDGNGDISDASFLLNWLFLGGAAPDCLAACNSNSDAAADISDASHLLNFLFLGGETPGAPSGPLSAFSQDANDAVLGCATPQG